MGRTNKRKESSVIFIGEDDDDKEPLLLNPFGGHSKKSSKKNVSKTKQKETSLELKPVPIPSSFVKYLFSEKSVIIRMLSSLCPPIGKFNRIAVDFEGAFLCTFILSAIVYWGLVGSNKGVKGEPSRLFSALHSFVLTVGYLVTLSLFTWAVSKATKTYINFRQIVCILGYGLFGHALVLLACETISDELFMPLMTVIGGLDSVRICLIIMLRTPVPAFRFVLCTPVAVAHLMYLLYLHFAIMKNY